MEETKRKILDIVKPFIESKGFELFEVSLKKHKGTIIEIIADKPEGGISLEECVSINKFLNNELEENDFIDDYAIEVSSPGLDRPLKTMKDFRRVLNKELQVYLSEKVEDKLQHDGILEEVNEQEIILKVKQNLIKIPYAKINKGMQVI